MDSIQSRAPIKSEECGDIEGEVEEFMKRHESRYPQFTIIRILLNPHIAKKMMETRNFERSFCKELAEIYHFFLHPQSLPERLVSDERFTKCY